MTGRDSDHPHENLVAERRIDLALPIIEGIEEVPDQTADILARARAEGILEETTGSRRISARRIWLAAAVVVLGVATAIAIALPPQEPQAETVASGGSRPTGDETPAAGGASAQTETVPVQPSMPGQNPASLLTGQNPSGRDPQGKPLSPDTPTSGNSWFAGTDLDLGTFYPRETAVGTFGFRNPTSETHRLADFRLSCNCTKARLRIGDREYVLEAGPDNSPIRARVAGKHGAEAGELVDSIAVGPREEGEIEVQMEMPGTRGPRSASIGFSLDDPELPSVTLSFRAFGSTYFTLTPPEVHLGDMLWDETREFEVEVTSPIFDDFTITGFDPPPPGMSVGHEKSARDGRTRYTIKGTCQPSSKGGLLVFHTDRDDHSFTVRVTANVKQPVAVVPPFASFGLIRKDTDVSRTVAIRPTKPFDLRVLGMESQNLTFDEQWLKLSWEPMDAGAVQVTVQILPGAPPGSVVRGDVVIHLNHPAATSRTIMFNGFVR